MDNTTYKVGQAPWETSQTSSPSFAVGKAPWEVSNQTGDVTSGNTTNDGFFTSLAKDPLKTLLVKPAIRLDQAIASGIGYATGRQDLIKNAEQGQTFDVPLLGKYYIEGQKPIDKGGTAQVAGDALNSASYLVPAGAAESAGSNLFKGNILKAAGGGALAGAQFGALAGAGQGFQEPDPTLGGVLEHTLLGGLTGAITGGVSGGTLAGASKVVGKVVNTGVADVLKSKVGLQSTQTTADNLYNKLADVNSNILNLTKNQINKETRFAKDTPLFIAKEAPDVSWNVTKDGRLDTTPVIDALEPKYRAEAQAFNLALKDSGQYANLDSFQKEAEAAATKEFGGTAQEGALKKIDNEILAYKKQYKNEIITHNGENIVPIHILDDIKSDLWSKTKFYGTEDAALSSQTSYLMGNTAKNIIEKTVTDSPIKAWNSRLGDFASAIKILNQRNGIQVGAGAYSKVGARILGGIAGHSLAGVPGEIAGMVTSDQLLKMASNPNVKSFVLKKLLQKMSKNGQQGIIDEVQKVMEQRALERGGRRLLPAPGQTTGKIELPSPGILEGQAKLRDQANASQIIQPTINASKNNNMSTIIPQNTGSANAALTTTIGAASALGVGAKNAIDSLNNGQNSSTYQAPVDNTPNNPNIIEGINISKYATDPNHEAKVNKIYNSIPETNDGSSLDVYLRDKFPSTPITGNMIYAAAKEYNVPVKLLTAIMQQDSGLGTKGLGVKTRNPGNVGNTDSGSTFTYPSWKDGVRGVARFLAKYRE